MLLFGQESDLYMGFPKPLCEKQLKEESVSPSLSRFSVVRVMGELMDTLKIVNEKAYNSALKKLT